MAVCTVLHWRQAPAVHPAVLGEEEPEPSPNGQDDDGQEPGLEGHTKDGDGPSLESASLAQLPTIQPCISS
jgi:hypothetical protein